MGGMKALTGAGASYGHLQEPPHLGNQYLEDVTLRRYLQRMLSEADLREVESDLERFGWEVATTVKEYGALAESEAPVLVKQDVWGNRIDELKLSQGWLAQKSVAAREGLVAIAYERRQGALSRVVQASKLMLYGASSGLFNCPLAMTDGAARLCELKRAAHPALADAFEHLTSRDPARFWTSGQWMTEKAGGSDVAAGTETVAVPAESDRTAAGSRFALHGYKWFTSAADGEMAMTLGRERDANGRLVPGNKGLSLFFVQIRRDAGPTGRAPRGFEVVRLKDKLGTRQLPTAELALDGLEALKVSDLGRGIAEITALVNITRYTNACAAVAFSRRMAGLAQDYARRRAAFGRPLARQPLAVRTLAWLEIHASGQAVLTLELARLLGASEAGGAHSAREAALLRMLTPLAKLYTAKQTVAVCSEGVEFFGGQGYIEGSRLPVILRDAQVLPIWEGTTNVLALDLLRVLAHDPQAARRVSDALRERAEAAARLLEAATAGGFRAYADHLARAPLPAELPAEEALRCARRAAGALRQAAKEVSGRLAAAAAAPRAVEQEAQARDLAMLLGAAFVGLLLLEQAAWSGGEPRDALLAAEWCREMLSGGEASLGEMSGTQRLAVAQVISGVQAELPVPRARPMRHGVLNASMAAVCFYTTTSATTAKARKDITKIRHILDVKRVQYEEVDLTDRPERRMQMLEGSYGISVLPQVHVNGKLVGLADGIQEMEDFGELTDVLRGMADPPPHLLESVLQGVLSQAY